MTNMIAAEQLRSYIERIERLRQEKKDLAEDEKLVFAELKANGFTPATVRDVLKRRAMRPADLQEAEALLDSYLVALGMAKEAPLFRHIGLMSVDLAAKESVIEAFKSMVPQKGEIIVKMGGNAVRLWRDKDGEAQAEDVIEKPAPAPSAAQPAAARPKREAPNCTPEEAVELGADAARGNQPVIANPFPWDDARRAKWDEGWRKEAGSDGMGPEEEG